MFISILWTIIYGIIEGITEWLPVSSTGHLIIFENLWTANSEVFTSSFLEMFRVVIQFGAILAVVVTYFQKLNPFSKKLSVNGKKHIWNRWIKIVIGCVPAGIVGLLLNDWFDEHFYTWQVVAGTLIIYGIFFIIVENKTRDKKPTYETMDDMPNTIALAIGCAQALALVPGTSRSGVTIICGLLIGASRVAVMDFTFCMAIPIMAGASGLKILKYFLEGNSFTGGQVVIILLGLAVAFVVSKFAIDFLLDYVHNNDFKPFGYYRIVLGGVLIILALLLPNVFNNGNSEYDLPSYVDEQYITINEYSRPDIALTKVNDIVIHYTANPGSTAQNNRDYFDSLSQQTDSENATYGSSNFIVGIDGEVIAVVPIDEIAYCSNSRNDDSISIEVCHETEDGKFSEAAYESVVKLTAYLCNRFGLDSSHVIRHYDVTGKLCPLYYVNNEDEWETLKDDVQQEINELTGETTASEGD